MYGNHCTQPRPFQGEEYPFLMDPTAMERYILENQTTLFYTTTQPLSEAIKTHPTSHPRLGSPDSNPLSTIGGASPPHEPDLVYSDRLPPTPPQGTRSPFRPSFKNQDPALLQHFCLNPQFQRAIDPSLISPTFESELAGGFPMVQALGPLDRLSPSPVLAINEAPRPPVPSGVLPSQRHMSPMHGDNGMMTATAVSMMLHTPISTRGETPSPIQRSAYPDPDSISEEDNEEAELMPVEQDGSSDSDYEPKQRSSHKRKHSGIDNGHTQQGRCKRSSNGGSSLISPVSSSPHNATRLVYGRPDHIIPTFAINGHHQRQQHQQDSTQGIPTRQYPHPQSQTTRRIPCSASTSLTCADCPNLKPFPTHEELARHHRTQHVRPFPCVFSFAGCTSTFGTKNEWKRHVSSQHLKHDYYLCTSGSCGKLDNRTGRGGSLKGSNGSTYDDEEEATMMGCAAGGEVTELGMVFNRKDLFTQHVKRMHPVGTASSTSSNSHSNDMGNGNRTGNRGSRSAVTTSQDLQDAHLRDLQTSSYRERCSLPTHMACPVTCCSHQFQGMNSWDDRMEHVAKHLESSATLRAEMQARGVGEYEDGDMVVFGDEVNDGSLLEWAGREDIGVIIRKNGGDWELRDPITGQSWVAGMGRRNSAGQGVRGKTARIRAVGEQDAEGEEE